jgi:hypothetical protein
VVLMVGDGGGTGINLIRGRMQPLGRQSIMSQTTAASAEIVGNCSSCRAQTSSKGRHKRRAIQGERVDVARFVKHGASFCLRRVFPRVFPSHRDAQSRYRSKRIHCIDGKGEDEISIL